MSLVLNGKQAASMRWSAAWSGVWIADVDLMPSAIADDVPSGRVTIASTSGIALVGTVDEERTASFADRRRVRVLGGAGGWSKKVREQHYHSDIGLQIREVASTTAAEVGEIPVVLTPKTVGLDYVRHAGLASQIFTDLGLDWWVAPDGTTQIGTRIRKPATPDVKVLDWDAGASTLSFTADALVEPGTIVADERFGTRVVRQVEAHVRDSSVTGTLWVAASAPEPGTKSEAYNAVAAIANEATRSLYGRFFEYFVDAMSGDRVELVAISPRVPNLVPVSIWAGISGYRAQLRPGSRVMVGFREGDSTKPFVAFYEAPEEDGWRPVELEIDALTKVTVGGMSASVVLGVEETALPLARAPAIQTFAAAIGQAVSVASAAVATAGGPIAPLAAILETMGKSIDAAAEAMGASLPSSKVRSS